MMTSGGSYSRARAAHADPRSSQFARERSRTGGLKIRGRVVEPAEVMEILLPLLSDDRIARIRDVVSRRTRTVVSVVEGAANMGNVNALMRTAEGLGFFEFHLVSGGETLKHARRSSQGAEKWMDITSWNSSHDCLRELKDAGYKIVTTSPDSKAEPLEVVDFAQRTALVFGNEVDGVSEGAMMMSDVVARIELVGFVESYNISVAAALCLYHAYRDRLSRLGYQGDLSQEEMDVLTAEYALLAVHRGEAIVAESLRRGQ